MANKSNQRLHNALDSVYARTGHESYAWGRALSLLLSVPGLRGAWPMSSFNDSGNALDLSGQGRTLTLVADTVYGMDGLAPYAEFDGTGDWLIRTDEAGQDIIGNEQFVKTGYQGLTVGGWFYFDRDTAREGLICKGSTAANTSFLLEHRGDVANNPIRFSIYDGAATWLEVDLNDSSTGAWHFCAGMYYPSSAITVFYDGQVNTNTTGVPATLANSTVSLYIGTYNGASGPLDGKASLCFLSGMCLNVAYLQAFYQHTRKLFRV